MDCHSCAYLRYDGHCYGHCVHRGHLGVVLSREDARRRRKEGVRVYNRQVCPDFELKQRCSNCTHWIRGQYFADGKTPAVKGRCGLDRKDFAEDCPEWARGRTSWKKREKEGDDA